MKKVFLFSFIFLLSFIFISCNPSDVGNDEIIDFVETEVLVEDVSGGTKGGTLNLRIDEFPDNFNYYYTSVLDDYIYDKLLHIDEYGYYSKPGLAKSYSVTKDEDSLELRFTIRKGLLWSDGEPVTIEDFVFTWNNIVNNKNLSTEDEPKITFFQDLEEEHKPTLSTGENSLIFSGVKDRKIVTKILEYFVPFPKHIFEDKVSNLDEFIDAVKSESFVGIGPFILKSYVDGEKIVLEKNPNYYVFSEDGKQLPYLDGIVLNVGSGSIVEDFENNLTDLTVVSLSDFDEMKNNESSNNYETGMGKPLDISNFIAFNWNAPNEKQRVWFRNVNFRKAISYALDRESLIDSELNGYGVPVYSPKVPGTKFYNETDVTKYEFSISKAEEELKKGGFSWDNEGNLIGPEGNLVSFKIQTNSENINREAIGYNLEKNLSALGMNITFETIVFNDLIYGINTAEYESIIIGTSGLYPDPSSSDNFWSLDGSLHFWNHSPDYLEGINPGLLDPEDYYVPKFEERIDEIFSEQSNIIDENSLNNLFIEWNNLVSENVPVIYSYAVNSVFVKRDNVTINVEPSYYVDLTDKPWTIWIE